MRASGKIAQRLNAGFIAGIFSLAVLVAPEAAQAAKTVTISTASTTITEGDSGKKDVTINFILGEFALFYTVFDVRVVAASSTATDNTNRTSCSDPSSNADICYVNAYADIDRGTSGSFKIGILGDMIDEGSGETLALRLEPTEPAKQNGWTQNSNTLILTIQDDDTAASAPAKPTGLKVSAGTSQATLSWTRSTDQSISGYQVQQKKGAGAWSAWTNISGSGRDTVSHTVTGLDNGSEYSFRIRAVNAAGNSAESDAATGTPMAPQVVVTPTELTINEGSGDVYTVVLAGVRPTGNVTIGIKSVAQGRDDRDVGELVFEPYNWNDPRTMTVYAPVIDNQEGYEFKNEFDVSAPGTNYADVEADDVTITVVDTTATLTLADDPAAVTEGANISLSITSDHALVGAIPVKLTFADRASSGFAAADLPGGLVQTLMAEFGSTGGTTGTVTIPTNNDSATSEGAETYTVTLGDDSTRNGYKLGADVTADGTLNDAASGTPTAPGTTKGVTVVPTTLTAAEGGGAGFLVVLDAAPSANVTITVSGDSGDVTFTTQGQGSDGSNWGRLTFTTSNWNVPQWVRVWVREDADMEDDTDVTLTLTASGGGYDMVTIDSVTITVAEDDKTMSPGGAEGNRLPPGSAGPPAAPGSPVEAPRRPRGFEAEAGDGEVALSWSDPGDATITHWQVWVRRGGWSAWTDIAGSGVATTGHTVTGLDNGKRYRFRVRAVNAAGPGVKSRRKFATPLGAPEVSIADASASEGEALVFGVTLSEPAAGEVSVAWRTASGGNHGSAESGSDFVQGSGVARFASGAVRAEVRIETLDDSHDEGRETFAVLLSDARGVVIAHGEATGMIVNSDPMPRSWLGRFGRSVAEQALDGISERMGSAGESARAPGFRGAFGGYALGGDSGLAANGCGSGDGAAPEAVGDGAAAERDCLADRFGFMAGQLSGGHTMDGVSGSGTFGVGAGSSPGHSAWPGFGGGSVLSRPPVRSSGVTAERSLGRLLAGSRFTYTRGEDSGGGVLGFWGRGSQSSFDGREGEVGLDGEVTTALLGVDYAKGRWLAGVALSQSRSDGGYRGAGGAAKTPATDGGIEASLTAAIPYASWRPSERLSLWGAVGHGSGAITLAPGAAESLETAIGWTMAAAGASGELLSFAGGGSLSLVSDALWARTTSARTDGLVGATAGVGRLRLGLEGSKRFALPGGGGLTPKLEIGARRDSGAAETGFGVEIGGGLAWSDPRLGIEFNVEGRALLTHEDGAMRDRGFSASLAYDPRPDSALGLTLALRQDLGSAASGGLDALFAHDPLSRRLGSDQDGRWTMEVGYGLSAFRGRFVGAPQLSYGVSAGAREVGVGWRLAPAAGAPDLGVAVRAVRREGLLEPADHRFDIEFRARW